MPEVLYRNRRAVQIENDFIRVTVLSEGGHVAEILDKGTGVNPLWTPPWPSIEPTTYNRAKHPEYGHDAESKLLAGIMGHNLCLDLWGSPSPEEAAAGLNVHGEAGVIAWDISVAGKLIHASCVLPGARLRFEREIELRGDNVVFQERVHNIGMYDRPIAWTQHVTLGPPFLDFAKASVTIPASRGRSYEGAEFAWQAQGGSTLDDLPPSGENFWSLLLDPALETAFFLASSEEHNLAISYHWPRRDFPWLGVWIENRGRATPPWNGGTVALGLEFAASPVPGPRREMVERGSLGGVPGYRWIGAGATLATEYTARIGPIDIREGE